MYTHLMFIVFINCFALFAMGQNSPDTLSGTPVAKITLEDIWASGKLATKGLPGFNFSGDASSYLKKSGNHILVYDITSGQITDTLLNGDQILDPDGNALKFGQYQISRDGKKFMLETDVTSIYRYSKKAFYYIWNTETATLQQLQSDKEQMYPSFNPDGDKVAFVSDNDLWIRDLTHGELTRVTDDGMYNHIINGASDWVYEEEFGLTRAYEWSPEGDFLAFIRFDESNVPEFTMDLYNDDLYPEKVTFKYPKVGEKNSEVSVWIYNQNSGNIMRAELGDMTDQYIPRIHWAAHPQSLIVFRMNRHQNQLELLKTDPYNGKVALLFKEVNPYYIDVTDDLTFLNNNGGFIWSSERSGYNHLYLYDKNGKLQHALTSGEYDVTRFYGVDEPGKRIYYQAADESPMLRNLYSVDLNGKNRQKLNEQTGYNHAQFSSTYDYFVNTHSTINSPPVYGVYNRKGELIRVIEDNGHIQPLQANFNVSPVDFFSFTTSDEVSLNGYMIKPADFDPQKKYPVLMFLYGGPNSQQVTDSWKSTNYWWFQHLAQNGYIVACVDNRGTGARGQAFRKITYLQLGHYETLDQIESARFLGVLPYIDADRIGIYGWSYGGYMSSLCLLKGNDVFKAAIAVAPVTNWKWYDTIYTERYMRTEKENPDGYKNNSPVYFADRLKGNYLLVHGMADDNVHFQHTVEMANALIKANKQFDTYFYPNKSHGISGGKTRLHLFTKMTQFLFDHL